MCLKLLRSRQKVPGTYSRSSRRVWNVFFSFLEDTGRFSTDFWRFWNVLKHSSRLLKAYQKVQKFQKVLWVFLNVPRRSKTSLKVIKGFSEGSSRIFFCDLKGSRRYLKNLPRPWKALGTSQRIWKVLWRFLNVPKTSLKLLEVLRYLEGSGRFLNGKLKDH